ncbi:MAG: phosphatidate cytidylyltransferase [Hyphomicrobiales bacterium]
MSKSASPSDFKTRLISALVLAPIVILLAWLGGLWFAALMIVVAAIMYWEWTTITVRAIDIRRDIFAGIIILALIIPVIIMPSMTPVLLSFALIAIGAFVVLIFKQKIGWNIAGAGVASSLALCLIYIRNSPDHSTGLILLIFLCFSVWAADIFAYLVGRTVGGPKLMPKVSPKKTWSGFLGGMAGAIFTGSMVAFIAAPDKIILFSFVALAVALAAQVGDLIESAIKRHFNVKDASNLIPGHGGVLDRVDGLTLAAYAFVIIHGIGIFD